MSPFLLAAAAVAGTPGPVDRELALNGVTFGDHAGVTWTVRTVDRHGGVVYSRPGDTMSYRGFPATEILYAEESKGAGVTLFAVKVSQEHCPTLRSSLDTSWGAPRALYGGKETVVYWDGQRVSAELDVRDAWSCILTLTDRAAGTAPTPGTVPGR